MKTECRRSPAHSRHAALLLSLCVIILTGLPGTWALATEVPFTAHTISTGALDPWSVFAADVDGDGDMDVLSASGWDDKIAWYESDGASPPSFTERVISTSADSARSVFAADVDGDGDLDVVSASYNDDKIAWYENDAGSPPSFTTRAISTATYSPLSIFAADLDDDGDVDVVSASSGEGTVAWYENDGASPPSFTQRVISTLPTDIVLHSVFAVDMDGDGDIDVLSAPYTDPRGIAWHENDGASPPSFTTRVISTSGLWAGCVFAADVDGDGDFDVLSALFYGDKIAWYENKGGQFALPTTDSSPARMFNSEIGDMLTTIATHNGRSGDTDMELVTLELLFEETPGDPLTSGEANALIENLFIYLDDGSGTFAPASDTLVSAIATLVLTAGMHTVAFADADPNVQVLYGTPETYFVVVELTADAGSQTPNSFMLTHLTETTSTAKDPNDIPLSLEYAANVSSTVVVLSALPPSFNVDDQFGQTVLSVSSDGDLFLTGNVTANAGSISATTGSEVLVKALGGQIAALIDVATGNLSLRGSVATGQTSLSNPAGADVVFKNMAGQVVGHITAAGDIVLKGDVHQNFVFP